VFRIVSEHPICQAADPTGSEETEAKPLGLRSDNHFQRVKVVRIGDIVRVFLRREYESDQKTLGRAISIWSGLFGGNSETVSISRQDNFTLLAYRILLSTPPKGDVRRRIGPINAVQP